MDNEQQMSNIVKSYPNVETLVESVWSLRLGSGPVAAKQLVLRRDGSIDGYIHQNERSWRIQDGLLEFLNAEGRVSTRFTEACAHAEYFTLSGLFLLEPSLDITLLLQQESWADGLPSFPLQTKFAFQSNIAEQGWRIGDHTYGKPRVYACGPERLVIGKYTSIGEEVTIVLAGHRPDYVTTYPFSLVRKHWRSVPAMANDHRGKGDVCIGNDVWIGHGALIAPGVQVEDGAVIGAMSVVTHNVPAYTIVAGNPAKLIRQRFTPAIIEQLLSIAWWDWPDAEVDEHTRLLLSNNIERFIEQVSKTWSPFARAPR